MDWAPVLLMVSNNSCVMTTMETMRAAFFIKTSHSHQYFQIFTTSQISTPALCLETVAEVKLSIDSLKLSCDFNFEYPSVHLVSKKLSCDLTIKQPVGKFCLKEASFFYGFN